MIWQDLPPLGTLVPFECAVRLGSVTAAAAELHLTHGAVSRQIQALERSLGLSLFERRNRAIVPTQDAVDYASQITDALNLLSSATRRVQRLRQSDSLVLSCEPTLLMRWLLPRLPALYQAVPGVDLHLSGAGGRIDLARQGVDIAVRRNDFAIPLLMDSTILTSERIGPVCSPDMASKISTIGDLSAVPLLHSATRPGAWTDWKENAPAPEFPARSETTFEHFYLSLQAAAAGVGVAIGPYALVADDLRDGRLVAPFGFVEDGSKYVFLSRDPGDTRVGLIREWFIHEMRNS
ncbi:LysR family glycine cleavage system transcriptional activator [Arthrobacter pascens]|uniref:LysR substrate-binding domain-containing protein n=1 Tax=Arthrobacter pascens TaxID=1677 RepID=UPI002781E0E1|nr:LysR substrate-binding domain-containing protein [Arthrobacter pascens]MDQ0634241.1 LysR family glycine cleavage system transcriptional activator [Arthrobacter pascens]